MSILDKEIIDGMALNKARKSIVFLITDHLDWSDEYTHLLELQEKINSYVLFFEGHQYTQFYKNSEVEYAVFEIHFLYSPTINGLNFLKQVQQQLYESKIEIEYVISKGDQHEN